MLLIQKKLISILNKRYYSNYYNRSVLKYKNIDYYLSVYDKLTNSKIPVLTKEEINHTDLIKFGTKIADVKKKIHLPFTSIKSQKDCDIIFYKMKIGVYKLVVELHFFKLRLVFFKYAFPSLSNYKEIEEVIKQKYFRKNMLIDFQTQCIVDKNNGFVKVDNDVTFSLFYYTPNFGFFDYLEKVRQDKLVKTERKNDLIFLELLNKL